MTKVRVSPRGNNAYLLRCRATERQVLIDAANAPDTLLSLIGDRGLDAVVTTHRHVDHHQALGEMVAATGATTVAHPADAPAIPVPTTKLVADHDRVRVGVCELETVHLRGHTPGSVALVYVGPGTTPRLWTGDSLLPGCIGRTATPSDFHALIEDLESKVFDRLPGDTIVHPGHGVDTTLGAEQPVFNQARVQGWRLMPHVARRGKRLTRKTCRRVSSLAAGLRTK